MGGETAVRENWYNSPSINEKTDAAGGLTEAEVARSRAEHGTNVLTPPTREPLWRKSLARLGDPMIVINQVSDDEPVDVV